MKKKVIGITLGDPGGIGPECVLKALHKFLPLQKKGVFFLLIGTLAALRQTSRSMKKKLSCLVHSYFVPDLLDPDRINLLQASIREDFSIRKVDGRNGEIAMDSIWVASDLANRGLIQGIMTAPVNKAAIQMSQKSFRGHTEFLAGSNGARNFAMMLQGGPLRVVLVTTHVPIKKVPSTISKKLILDKTELTYRFLHKELGRKPRIGIAGLNPHAGERGILGNEEMKIIEPALKALKKRRIFVIGPLPSDTIFRQAYLGKLDAVICMYHDQGLGPLKMIAFDEGINVTLGLSYPRSSPDHGTAFDIAYQNKANPLSTQRAIEFLL